MFKNSKLEARIARLEKEVEDLKSKEGKSNSLEFMMPVLLAYLNSNMNVDTSKDVVSEKVHSLDKRLTLVENKVKCKCKKCEE